MRILRKTTPRIKGWFARRRKRGGKIGMSETGSKTKGRRDLGVLSKGKLG